MIFNDSTKFSSISKEKSFVFLMMKLTINEIRQMKYKQQKKDFIHSFIHWRESIEWKVNFRWRDNTKELKVFHQNEFISQFTLISKYFLFFSLNVFAIIETRFHQNSHIIILFIVYSHILCFECNSHMRKSIVTYAFCLSFWIRMKYQYKWINIVGSKKMR